MSGIKFRVWTGLSMQHDVVAGKFGYFYVNPGEKGDGLDAKDSASLTPFNTKYDDRFCPLMQYIGRNDKNGKEIYEGDFVKVKSNDEEIGMAIARIVYEDDFCRFSLLINMEQYTEMMPDFETFGVCPDDELEVIGNLYENPELLKHE